MESLFSIQRKTPVCLQIIFMHQCPRFHESRLSFGELASHNIPFQRKNSFFISIKRMKMWLFIFRCSLFYSTCSIRHPSNWVRSIPGTHRNLQHTCNTLASWLQVQAHPQAPGRTAEKGALHYSELTEYTARGNNVLYSFLLLHYCQLQFYTPYEQISGSL